MVYGLLLWDLSPRKSGTVGFRNQCSFEDDAFLDVLSGRPFLQGNLLSCYTGIPSSPLPSSSGMPFLPAPFPLTPLVQPPTPHPQKSTLSPVIRLPLWTLCPNCCLKITDNKKEERNQESCIEVSRGVSMSLAIPYGLRLLRALH